MAQVDDLDRNHLDMLVDGDAEFAEELFREYSASIVTEIAGIRETAIVGDMTTLGRHAHTIKGASANLGLTGVVERARMLEQLGERVDAAGYETMIAELEQAFEAGKNALATYINRLRQAA